MVSFARRRPSRARDEGPDRELTARISLDRRSMIASLSAAFSLSPCGSKEPVRRSNASWRAPSKKLFLTYRMTELTPS